MINFIRLLLLLFPLFFALIGKAQPNFDLVGFATQNGGTKGGAGGQTVTATSYSQLKSYAESSTTYIIMVQGTISNGSSGGVVNVNSNKSIIGVGSTAFLSGVSINISSKNNIILQNFKISLVGTSTPKNINDGDCIGISGTSKNIWIDHLELFSEDPNVQKDIDKYDGLIDIKQQTGFITISWCYLHDHHKGCLVGASDTDLYADRKITYHHNYFNKIKLRVPMYRGATGHFFNNYIKDAQKASEIRANTCLRIEKNYYENFSEFAIYTTSDSPGNTDRIDNYLSKSQSRAYPSNCSSSMPYSYTSALTNNPQDVKSVVMQYAGVGKIGTACTPTNWYSDNDNDGKGDPNIVQSSCTQPSGYVADKTDLCPNDGAKSDPGQCGCGVPESVCVDCAGIKNGTAVLDNCGICTGGNTGQTACLDMIQGENFCASEGVSESSNLGFIGDGYVNFDNTTGTSGTWNLFTTSAGTYNLGIRYANGGTAARSMSVSVNGINQATLTGAPTTAWNNWRTEFLNLNLVSGVNQIQLTSLGVDGGPNIDLFSWYSANISAGGCGNDCNGILGGAAYIDNCNTCVGGNTGKTACIEDCEGVFGGTATLDNCGVCISPSSMYKPCTGNIEAEDACSFDGTIDNDNEGFKGQGFINTTNIIGSKITWNLNSYSDQAVTISYRYANGGTTSRDGSISINGNSIGTLLMPPTGSWTTWKFVTLNINLIQGINTLEFASLTSDGMGNIDLLAISDKVSTSGCIITGSANPLENNFAVFPNPTNSIVSWGDEYFWILKTIHGNKLDTGTGNSINLSSYKQGIYILEVNNQTIKLIRQ